MIEKVAIQARAELVCDTLELPIDLAEGVADDLWRFIRFCRQTGASADWLVRGDVRGMIRQISHNLSAGHSIR
jgi:hypothetical protein